MKPAVRRTTTVFAAVATAGASSLFLGVAPAYAAPTEACGATGELVAPGICEQTFTSGSSVFTPTAEMTKLEMLLVGAGGAGADQSTPNTNGYAAAGGGGGVEIIDFGGTTLPLTVTVGVSGGAPTTVSNGMTGSSVANGGSPVIGAGTGGSSGSGNAGAPGGSGEEFLYGSGGGAGASPMNNVDGGAGVIVNTIATSGSLFGDDTRCFGGGGAIGFSGIPADPQNPEENPAVPAAQGEPGCGGGGPTDATATALTTPIANSGGGGGGLNISQSPEARAGASGFVAIRWDAANVTLSFDVNGHGTAPADQTVPAGTTPTSPTDPTASGYEFDGWYADAALTTPANFAAPLTASATLYAKWLPVLAATGATVDPTPLWVGFGALFAGAALVFAGSRRRKTN